MAESTVDEEMTRMALPYWVAAAGAAARSVVGEQAHEALLHDAENDEEGFRAVP